MSLTLTSDYQPQKIALNNTSQLKISGEKMLETLSTDISIMSLMKDQEPALHAANTINISLLKNHSN